MQPLRSFPVLLALPALGACSADADGPRGGDGATSAGGAAGACASGPCTPGGGVAYGGQFPVGGAPSVGGTGNVPSGAGNPGMGGVPAGAGGLAGAAGSPAAGGDPGGGGAPSAACVPDHAIGHFQMEALGRGLVAVRSGSGNYVGWRMLGHEYDRDHPENTAYELHRDGALVATVTDSTNYQDDGAPPGASYTVAAVLAGERCPASEPVATRAANYLSIPLAAPPGGTTPSGESYAYDVGTVTRSSGAVNDGSPGDVDGDGEYELIVTWQPSSAHDNSESGYTGPVYMDAYTLAGARLWRLNLGRNVRAGAHYTQFVVYDFDGDGRAEVALRTAPGTQDATGAFLSKGPAATDDDAADYRNSGGYVLSGPEYLTVFDGATGVELSTANFEIARGKVSDWGDDYGNRVDRFLASAGFVSDLGGSGVGSGRPAILMARGYYTRATVTAWTWRDGELRRIWTGDSENTGSGALAGQGSHSMQVADVDGDGAQEIVYGAGMWQSDGSFGCATGFGHGDALHVGDLIPSRPGLEVFMPHEDKSKPWWDVRDARTCEVLHVSSGTGQDNGRGVADDIIAENPGAEFWSSSDPDLRSATTGAVLGSRPGPTNFLVWWDGDELRDLEDGTTVTNGKGVRLLECRECMSNNHTKATPTLTADLFGDWREEIVWRNPTSSELRIYTTTALTRRRIYTLMHDPQYRMQVTAEQTAYNQPPHPGFFLGDGMDAPPRPDITTR